MKKSGTSSEGPQHEVTIDYPFALGKRYAVTFAEWDAALAAGAKLEKPERRRLGTRRQASDQCQLGECAGLSGLAERQVGPRRKAGCLSPSRPKRNGNMPVAPVRYDAFQLRRNDFDRARQTIMATIFTDRARRANICKRRCLSETTRLMRLAFIKCTEMSWEWCADAWHRRLRWSAR